MKIAEGLEMLTLPGIMGSGEIHPAVIWDNQNVVLVDTGFPGQLSVIRDQMNQSGIPFEKLTKIIITHHDLDHIGSLRSILEALPQHIEVIAHSAEKPYIEGTLPPVKMKQVEERINSMTGEQAQKMKEFHEKIKAAYPKHAAQVTTLTEDGEVLPCCGGIQIIATPGHTPGHISVYIRQSKTLITGDTLNCSEGILVPSPKATTLDTELAARSLEKFTSLDIETVICYHGGLYRDNPNERIAQITGQV